MHKSNRKARTTTARDIYAARIAGAKTKSDLYRLGYTDEAIASTRADVDELIDGLANGVFNAVTHGARTESQLGAAGYTPQECALVQDRVAKMLAEIEPIAA